MRSARIQFSLRWLLGISAVVGIALGFYLKSSNRVVFTDSTHYFVVFSNGRNQRHTLYCKWAARGQQIPRLHYMVLNPYHCMRSVGAANALNYAPSDLTSLDLALHPEGIHCQGVFTAPSEECRIFVCRRDRPLLRVELPQDELTKFDPEFVDNIEGNSIWKNTLLPILKKEAERNQ